MLLNKVPMEQKKMLYECPESVPVEMDTEVMLVVSGESEPFGGLRDDFDWVLW